LRIKARVAPQRCSRAPPRALKYTQAATVRNPSDDFCLYRSAPSAEIIVASGVCIVLEDIVIEPVTQSSRGAPTGRAN